MRVDIPVGLHLLLGTSLTVARNQSPITAVEEDSTSGLVVEVFDDLDKVCADVVLLHGGHKAACQTLSKAFLKSMKTW